MFQKLETAKYFSLSFSRRIPFLHHSGFCFQFPSLLRYCGQAVLQIWLDSIFANPLGKKQKKCWIEDREKWNWWLCWNEESASRQLFIIPFWTKKGIEIAHKWSMELLLARMLQESSSQQVYISEELRNNHLFCSTCIQYLPKGSHTVELKL